MLVCKLLGNKRNENADKQALQSLETYRNYFTELLINLEKIREGK